MLKTSVRFHLEREYLVRVACHMIVGKKRCSKKAFFESLHETLRIYGEESFLLKDLDEELMSVYQDAEKLVAKLNILT